MSYIQLCVLLAMMMSCLVEATGVKSHTEDYQLLDKAQDRKTSRVQGQKEVIIRYLTRKPRGCLPLCTALASISERLSLMAQGCFWEFDKH